MRLRKQTRRQEPPGLEPLDLPINQCKDYLPVGLNPCQPLQTTRKSKFQSIKLLRTILAWQK